MKKLIFILPLLAFASTGFCSGKGFDVEKIYKHPQQLASNKVLDVCSNAEFVAVATQKGLNMLIKASRSWLTLEGITGGETVERVKIVEGELWCMSAHTLAAHNLDSKKNRVLLNDKHNRFNNFAVSKGTAYAATAKGLYVVNLKSKGKVLYNSSNGLLNENILDVYVKGDFVFAAPAGIEILMFNPDSGLFSAYSSGDTAFANTNIVLGGGSLWCGTKGRGLREFDLGNESWRLYTIEHGLSDDFVHGLAIDGSYLWAATFNGLNLLDLKNYKIQNYSTLDGLPDNSITSVSVDGNHLWVGSDNGLAYVNKAFPQVVIDSENSFFTENNIKDKLYFELEIKGGSNIKSFDAHWSLESFRDIWSNQNIKLGQLSRHGKAQIIWDIRDLASFNDVYFLKAEAVDSAGNRNADFAAIKFDAVNPIVKIDPIVGIPEAGPYKLTGTYNKIGIKEVIINPGGIKAVLNPSLYSFSAIINLEPGINIVEAVIIDRLGRKASELVEIDCELKEISLIARQDEENIVPMEEAREILLTDKSVKIVKPKKVFLSEMVLFYPGSVKVRESSYKFLENLSSILNKNQSLRATVEGYAYSEDVSNTPFMDNKELSLARALIVGDYLVKNSGISKSRLKMIGLSSNKVLVTPKSESDEDINRRAEIHLSAE